MTNTRTEAKPETRVFAFDIDNVLVTPIESYDDIDIEYLHSLHKNNLIIAAAGMEHIIHPGVIELIQYFKLI